MIETYVYCDKCNNKIDEDNIICKYCYYDLQDQLDDANHKIDTLNKEIAKLEEFKEDVINSPDCPKEIAKRVVAERL